MKDDDEEEENTFGVVRYPCMPSLVALQQMRNRLHLAFLGRKLMKWTALATGREMRRIAVELYDVYQGFGEDMRNAFILLARSRYFYPQLNHIVTEDIAKKAAVIVQQSSRSVSGVKIVQFEIFETGYPSYEHLGIEKGGQTILETKKAWLDLLRRLIMMMQLRTSFIMVELANKNATKKWNVLSKLVIPRVNLSCRYIVSELEEIEREDNFRLKRFKELKLKKTHGTDEVCKKEICTCQKLQTGDGFDPCCLVTDTSNIKTNIQEDEEICCETDTEKIKSFLLDDQDKDKDLCANCALMTPLPADNVTDIHKEDVIFKDVQEFEYIFSGCENMKTQQESINEDTCGCQLLKSRDNLKKCVSIDGAQGDKKFEYIFECCKKVYEKICSFQPQLDHKDSDTNKLDDRKSQIYCVNPKIINEDNKFPYDFEPLKSQPKVSFDENKIRSDIKITLACNCSLSDRQQQPNDDKKTDINCACHASKMNAKLDPNQLETNKTASKYINACCGKSSKNDTERKHQYIFSACPKEAKAIDNSPCICESVQSKTEISHADKAMQTGSLSDLPCPCQLAEQNKDNESKEHEYIFSACKKIDSFVCPPRQKKQRELKDEESKIICIKFPTREGGSKYPELKNSQILSDNSIQDNNNKSVCCQFDKLEVVINFHGKERKPSPAQSKAILKKESCVCQTKTESQSVNNTNSKTETRNVNVSSCTSARNIMETSTSPILISPCNKIAETSSDNRSSIVTIVSITSTISSDRGLETEEGNGVNGAQTCSKCSSKNSSSNTKSKIIGQDSTKSGTSSCKIKIVSKSNNNLGKSSSYENKVELTPSTFNIIKRILCNLNNLEANNNSFKPNHDQSTLKCNCSSNAVKFSEVKSEMPQSKSEPCKCSKSSDFKSKISSISCKPINNKKRSTCSCSLKCSKSKTFSSSCKHAERLKQSKERSCTCHKKSLSKSICSASLHKSSKYACGKSKVIPKSYSCHETKTSMTIQPSKSCTCSNSEANFNIEEKPVLESVENKSKSRQCGCSVKKTNSVERFAFETKNEVELSSCPCSKTESNRKNQKTPETNRSSCKCKQTHLNKSDSMHKSSCKSSVTSFNISVSVMSIPNSDEICSKCASSVSVDSATHDQNNSTSQKSLRFSNSSKTTRMKSCSCTTDNSSCLKPSQSPCCPELKSSNSCLSVESIPNSDQICSKCASSVSVGSGTHDENNYVSPKSFIFSNTSTKTNSCSCTIQNVSKNYSQNSSSSKARLPCCPKLQSKDSICSKCSESKKDAATLTRRSDKYDVRPLRLLMETRKLDCTCKSDSAVIKYKKPKSPRLLNKCCSLHDNQKYRY